MERRQTSWNGGRPGFARQMLETSLLDSNTKLNAAKFTWRGQFSADQVWLTFREGGSKLNKAENILLSAEERGEARRAATPY